MRKILQIGGFVAATILVAFGIATIAMGVNGHNTVHTTLQQEHIVGTADMTPALIKEEAAKAGLPSTISLPTESVAGEQIDTGSKARAFASYIRIHALEASGGLTYSQLPRYATEDGKGTNDAAVALQSDGRPVGNPARDTWVTATALSTALNSSYMASQLSLFAIVVGIALLLTGIGFAILAAAGALGNAKRATQPSNEAAPILTSPAIPTT